MSLQHSQWNQSGFILPLPWCDKSPSLLTFMGGGGGGGGGLHLLTSNTDVSTTVSLTKWQKKYHLERPINGQNMIVWHV